ncbi:MAG TPA: hypothetical protein VIK18_07565 [Pirellulales bacterium]
MSISFAIGDHVQVLHTWFVSPMRGAIGKVAAPPEGVADKRSSGIYWIEFEEPWPESDSGHPIEASEVDAPFLRRA